MLYVIHNSNTLHGVKGSSKIAIAKSEVKVAENRSDLKNYLKFLALIRF